jgi:hypothetical protein
MRIALTTQVGVALILLMSFGKQAPNARRDARNECIGSLSGFPQTSDPEASAAVRRIMATALSRCYSTINAIPRISFEPPTNEEVAGVKALGNRAVAPLTTYLDLERKDGLTQLFAVKFLMAIGGPSMLGPLKRAFAQDQWEVTRAAALDGMFEVSRAEAKPYVEAALGDRSQLILQRAHDLWSLYQGQMK